MKKRIFSFALCVIMVICILPVYAFAEDSLNDWTFNVLSEEEKTAEITGYNGTENELVFPEEIDGYTMVAIADNAFKYNSLNSPEIYSITVPETYKRIGKYFFYGCGSLSNIELPHSLEYIGEFAFLITDYYNNEICKNEQNVVYIGEYCISSQQGSEYPELFPDSYTIKQGTKLIATSAFFRADRLKKIIIPNGVEYINDGAFFWCQSLKSVVIPNTVKNLGLYSFGMCRSLSAVVIPESVEYIDDLAFWNSGSGNLTIYGEANTVAEKYASEHSLQFVELNDVIYGDIDEDGVVTIADYASTKSCVLGVTEFAGCAEIIGDMNSDCVIDAFDLFEIDKTVNA